MYELGKSKSSSHENWLDSFDKIQDSARKNYFAVLPSEEEILKYFSEAFVINIPKGNVGGDGFWLHTNGNEVFLALFTCVGDGHLANMMIRIYMSALKKMVEGYAIDFPGSILQFLHREVLARFKDRNNILLNTNANVGIVKVNLQTKEMEFAGANMNLLQVNKSGTKVITGEEHQVGQSSDNVKSYSSISLENPTESSFYLCSTGTFNLIGGPDMKKMNVENIGKFWKDHEAIEMAEQKVKTEHLFNEWTGVNGQNDDIMVIGFKL